MVDKETNTYLNWITLKKSPLNVVFDKYWNYLGLRN